MSGRRRPGEGGGRPMRIVEGPGTSESSTRTSSSSSSSIGSVFIDFFDDFFSFEAADWAAQRKTGVERASGVRIIAGTTVVEAATRRDKARHTSAARIADIWNLINQCTMLDQLEALLEIVLIGPPTSQDSLYASPRNAEDRPFPVASLPMTMITTWYQ